MNSKKNNDNKQQPNTVLNINDIISNINSLNNKKELVEIQLSLNETFMNISFIKNPKEKKEIISHLFPIIFNNSDDQNSENLTLIYISLSFLTLLETKIKNIPIYILESFLIDNLKIIDLYKKIFLSIYNKNLQTNNFQIPNIKNFINFIFKYPDIINNFFEISFINTSQYYLDYFKMLLNNILILEIRNNNILKKIFSLKLFDILFKAMLESSDDNNILFFELILKEELYKDEYVKKFIQFSDFTTKTDFLKIQKIYHILDNFEKFGKIQKILRKNMFFISHILCAENEYLQKKFFDEILIVLKEKNNILEEIEIYEFYQVFFCIFFLLEKYNGFDYLDIFDSLMKISFTVMEVVKDKNKKAIIQLFLFYVKKKMVAYLKSKGATEKDDLEVKDEESLFNESAKNLLNFDLENKKKYDQNIFYFCESINSDSFKIKFFKIILNINIEIVESNDNDNDNIIVYDNNEKEDKEKNKKPKTIYKSIKFQKKYGVYDPNKSKQLITEINNSNNKNDIIPNEINLPFYNSNSNLKIHLESKDDFNDLYKIKSPVYLKDCILGLHSQYRDRQELSLKALPDLIESQPMDLDFYVKSLTLSLLNMSDNFDLDEIEELKEQSLVKLAKYNPEEVTLIFCEKFFSENNCGLKNKFLIINVLNRTVTELSEYYIANKKPKVNNFHVYFNNIIFPLLSYLKKSKLNSLIIFKDFDLLLAKFMILISNIINVSENHPIIYRALFEVFDLFEAVINLKEIKEFKTFTLLESLNCFVNVTLNFYEKKFVDIYPEFLPKFKIEIEYLNNLLDDKQLNDELRFKILGTLNKFSIQSDKLRESYLGNQNEQRNINNFLIV